MSFKFEKLNIWDDARLYTGKIYEISKKFPKDERFCLVDQIRMAGTSISLNIAEGSIRYSDADFSRFIRISLGSLFEVVTILYIARDQGYINDPEFQEIYKISNSLGARLSATINSIKK